MRADVDAEYLSHYRSFPMLLGMQNKSRIGALVHCRFARGQH
jgi:hypothetical protein